MEAKCATAFALVLFCLASPGDLGQTEEAPLPLSLRPMGRGLALAGAF